MPPTQSQPEPASGSSGAAYPAGVWFLAACGFGGAIVPDASPSIAMMAAVGDERLGGTPACPQRGLAARRGVQDQADGGPCGRARNAPAPAHQPTGDEPARYTL